MADIHHGFICDVCGMSPIIGLRYRSKKVPNWDCCSLCVNSLDALMAQPLDAIGRSAGVHARTDVHEGFCCDVCKMMPIQGVRYRSKKVPNWDCCSNCINLLEAMVYAPFEAIGQSVGDHGATVHTGIRCDICEMMPILGVRYRSETVPDWDCCSNCVNNPRALVCQPFEAIRQPVVQFENPAPIDMAGILRAAAALNLGSQPESPTATRGGGDTQGVLSSMGVCLTDEARKGKLDPVIGRDAEVQQCLEILCRRTKNNPVLVGEPGVGKTAVAEAVAQLMAAGRVPGPLKGYEMWSINVSALSANTKYRGEMEERILQLLQAVEDAGRVVVFMDEIHQLVGAGQTEGDKQDAAQILKPALARGKFPCIGATTLKEYTQYVESDGALERRFQKVLVGPPSEEDAITILNGLRPRLEQHHSVSIEAGAVVAAVRLSERYVTDRHLPDKAIDLLDTAAARKAVAGWAGPSGRPTARGGPSYRAATAARSQPVTEADVAQVLAEWTGIPVQRLGSAETQSLLDLPRLLEEHVKGQPDAVQAVARAVQRARAGLADPRRPQASFLFLGPTGVGKTELAKALAACLFHSKDAMVRLDMSEYMEKNSASRLVGAAPGLVGYEDGGQLTEPVRRRPYSIVLLDEVEKAHPDITNLLLQVLDDGRLTDSKGHVVSFKNTVVILTSNLGAAHILASAKATDTAEQQRLREAALAQVQQHFRPELLNRIDQIIQFRPLGREQLGGIVRMQVDQVAARLADRNMRLELLDGAVEWLADKGFDPTYGARPVKRVIQRELETPLTDGILRGTFRDGVAIVIDAQPGAQALTLSLGGQHPAAAGLGTGWRATAAPSWSQPSSDRRPWQR